MTKNKGGRPKIQYDKNIAEQVQGMSQYGTPQDEIASYFNIDPKTLRNLYRDALDKGHFLAKLSVRKKLYERCMAGDTACLIFYAKTQLGWRETDKNKEQPKGEDTGRQLAEAIRNAMKSVGKQE